MSIAEIRSYVTGRSQIGSATFDHVRPVDGAVIGRIFEADAEGVEAAVRLAFSVYQANRKTRFINAPPGCRRRLPLLPQTLAKLLR